MESNLIIPTKIKVGFQKRSDTFTQKLAYVIYYDHKGKLRKEQSWNGWRDQAIEPLEFDNVPTPNFTLNKGIQRVHDWRNSGRSVVRVWDPRDFEFEISVDNLMNILMHSDVSKRDITQSCVYAWNGTELVLLPTNSEVYQQSVVHTAKQAKKFSSKNLVVGYTYDVRKEPIQVVYLGRFDRYEIEPVEAAVETRYSKPVEGYRQISKKDKAHVFIDPSTKIIYTKDPSAFIAQCASEENHPNLAALFDHYYGSVNSQPIVDVAVGSGTPRYGAASGWAKIGDNEYARFTFARYHYSNNTNALVEVQQFARFNYETNQLELSYPEKTGTTHGWYSTSFASYPGRDLPNMHSSRLDVQAMLERFRIEYRAVLDQSKQITDWQQQYKMIETYLEEQNLRPLSFVLADGKVSHDYQI